MKANEEKIKADEEKMKAAYALNMCTVSVSQIIDYNDLNILEQEYDGILNNLNLEQIPKDDALLHVIKQLLDTITYFRIEDGEKEMIDKEYQQKVKNAIWASAPNFGILVATGEPITVAVSLISQIGVGFMNYRKNKAEYALDKQRKYWELKKTALEQFNGLRRELFHAAWRLADTYGFPDEYRLSEKQIMQYNKILMDHDEIRKYERLDSIKEYFEAYPPFWYYIGNTANFIARDQRLKLSEEVRKEYSRNALSYFEKFENLNKYNILREDAIAASCALEHVDILLEEKKIDSEKINDLLYSALKSSRNSFDTLELCAFAFMKKGDYDEAMPILKKLVNERYNEMVNAQLLSSMYVAKNNRANYEILCTRIDSQYLFPFPEAGKNIKDAQSAFEFQQKNMTKSKCQIILGEYYYKYTVRWNEITSVFEERQSYEDKFFLETPKAKEDRKKYANKIYMVAKKRKCYQEKMMSSEYELEILDLLNEMVTGLFVVQIFADDNLKTEIIESIKKQIIDNSSHIDEIQRAMKNNEFTEACYIESQKISMTEITGRAFNQIIDYVSTQIVDANMEGVFGIESDLRRFCMQNDLEYPEIFVNREASEYVSKEEDREPFGPDLFGSYAVSAKQEADYLKSMSNFIRDEMQDIILKNNDITINFFDTEELSNYFESKTFANHSLLKNRTLMILNDQTKSKHDILFTIDGIVNVTKGKVRKVVPYKDIEYDKEAIYITPCKYYTTALDISSLYKLIKQLSEYFVKNLNDKIEHIDGEVSTEILREWFVSKKGEISKESTCVYAVPKIEVLEKFGCYFEMDFSVENHLIQFVYDDKRAIIQGIRVVYFDAIEEEFKKTLEKKEYISNSAKKEIPW